MGRVNSFLQDLKLTHLRFSTPLNYPMAQLIKTSLLSSSMQSSIDLALDLGRFECDVSAVKQFLLDELTNSHMMNLVGTVERYKSTAEKFEREIFIGVEVQEFRNFQNKYVAPKEDNDLSIDTSMSSLQLTRLNSEALEMTRNISVETFKVPQAKKETRLLAKERMMSGSEPYHIPYWLLLFLE